MEASVLAETHEKPTEEVVNDWDRKIRENISKIFISHDKDTLYEFMKEYVRFLEQNACLIENTGMLKEKVLRHVKSFYLCYMELKSETVMSVHYLNNMEIILTYYCDLELKEVRNLKRSGCRIDVNKIVKKVCNVLSLYLIQYETHIFHVLMRMRYCRSSKICKKIVDGVYSHFLCHLPRTDFSDEAFCRYYIVLQHWKQIRRNQEFAAMENYMYKVFNRCDENIEKSAMLKEILMPRCQNGKDLSSIIAEQASYSLTKYSEYLKKKELQENEPDSDQISKSVAEFVRLSNDHISALEKEIFNSSNVEELVEVIRTDEDDDVLFICKERRPNDNLICINENGQDVFVFEDSDDNDVVEVPITISHEENDRSQLVSQISNGAMLSSSVGSNAIADNSICSSSVDELNTRTENNAHEEDTAVFRKVKGLCVTLAQENLDKSNILHQNPALVDLNQEQNRETIACTPTMEAESVHCDEETVQSAYHQAEINNHRKSDEVENKDSSVVVEKVSDAIEKITSNTNTEMDRTCEITGGCVVATICKLSNETSAEVLPTKTTVDKKLNKTNDCASFSEREILNSTEVLLLRSSSDAELHQIGSNETSSDADQVNVYNMHNVQSEKSEEKNTVLCRIPLTPQIINNLCKENLMNCGNGNLIKVSQKSLIVKEPIVLYPCEQGSTFCDDTVNGEIYAECMNDYAKTDDIIMAIVEVSSKQEIPLNEHRSNYNKGKSLLEVSTISQRSHDSLLYDEQNMETEYSPNAVIETNIENYKDRSVSNETNLISINSNIRSEYPAKVENLTYDANLIATQKHRFGPNHFQIRDSPNHHKDSIDYYDIDLSKTSTCGEDNIIAKAYNLAESGIDAKIDRTTKRRHSSRKNSVRERKVPTREPTKISTNDTSIGDLHIFPPKDEEQTPQEVYTSGVTYQSNGPTENTSMSKDLYGFRDGTPVHQCEETANYFFGILKNTQSKSNAIVCSKQQNIKSIHNLHVKNEENSRIKRRKPNAAFNDEGVGIHSCTVDDQPLKACRVKPVDERLHMKPSLSIPELETQAKRINPSDPLNRRSKNFSSDILEYSEPTSNTIASSGQQIKAHIPFNKEEKQSVTSSNSPEMILSPHNTRTVHNGYSPIVQSEADTVYFSKTHGQTITVLNFPECRENTAYVTGDQPVINLSNTENNVPIIFPEFSNSEKVCLGNFPEDTPLEINLVNNPNSCYTGVLCDSKFNVMPNYGPEIDPFEGNHDPDENKLPFKKRKVAVGTENIIFAAENEIIYQTETVSTMYTYIAEIEERKQDPKIRVKTAAELKQMPEKIHPSRSFPLNSNHDQVNITNHIYNNPIVHLHTPQTPAADVSWYA